MRAAHVLGIAHSGTTIMDRILSSYPGVIGLGEAQQMWKKLDRGTLRENHMCPCGQQHQTCPFWGGVLGRTYRTPEDYFARLVEQARELGFELVVDTSKAFLSSGAFTTLHSGGVLDEVIQIRLVRDPRGWVRSMIRRNGIDRGNVNAIRALFYRWLFTYVKLDRKVIASDSRVIYVWYDKLALEESQNRLAELIGLPLPPGGQISLAHAAQHAIAGNKFVHSSARDHIRYDGSWLGDAQLDDIYAGLPALRAYYHEVQRLHLTCEGKMLHDRSVEVGQAEIDAAEESGRFEDIEEQAGLLSCRALQPAANP